MQTKKSRRCKWSVKTARRQEPGNGETGKQSVEERELGGTWKQHKEREGRSRAEGRLVKSIKGEKECECRLNSKNRLVF